MASAALAANTSPRETYEAAFAEHVQNFGLKFANGAEFVARLQIFADNMDTINAHPSCMRQYQHCVSTNFLT
jgi:methanogenic corrinoid protein MtbC1